MILTRASFKALAQQASQMSEISTAGTRAVGAARSCRIPRPVAAVSSSSSISLSKDSSKACPEKASVLPVPSARTPPMARLTAPAPSVSLANVRRSERSRVTATKIPLSSNQVSPKAAAAPRVRSANLRSSSPVESSNNNNSKVQEVSPRARAVPTRTSPRTRPVRASATPKVSLSDRIQSQLSQFKPRKTPQVPTRIQPPRACNRATQATDPSAKKSKLPEDKYNDTIDRMHGQISECKKRRWNTLCALDELEDNAIPMAKATIKKQREAIRALEMELTSLKKALQKKRPWEQLLPKRFQVPETTAQKKMIATPRKEPKKQVLPPQETPQEDPGIAMLEDPGMSQQEKERRRSLIRMAERSLHLSRPQRQPLSFRRLSHALP